ncbi:DUF6461 domain-containing protein, partial [Streptomyces sp. UNOC14_S4]|uniref:DUF6461 domain-containing protein n=1 Tax=Streptomyces sp. UNOC14_S4 TaxID=2872340 RepID=UPI001E292267
MSATAADYVWFEEGFPELAEAYCFTLVRGVAPDELLRRLGGREEKTPGGLDAFVDAAFDLHESGDEDGGEGEHGSRQFVAMTSVGGWTLMIEPNGYVGVTEDRALVASAGTCWVSHFVNIDGVDSFLWAEDTARRLSFEPTFPDHRYGSTPDAALAEMEEAGFPLGREEPEGTEKPARSSAC